MPSLELWRESLRVAWQTLRGNLLRTLLTALSVSLGAGAISLMVSLSKSGVATLTAGIDKVGGRQMMFLFSKTPEKGVMYDVTSKDAEAIRSRVPGIHEVAYLQPMKNQVIVGNGKKAEVDLGIGSSFRRFVNQPLAVGVDVPADGSPGADARVTVLSHQVATELFGSSEGAIGQNVVVWGHRYRVTGVTARATTMGFNLAGVSKERLAFFSASAMLRHEGVRDDGFLIVVSDGGVTHDHMIGVMHAVVSARHHGQHDVEVFDFAKMIGKFDQVFLGLRVLTGLIAAVSLFIAGAGIMNVLLASVRQRVKEIGIRRALGATQANIQSQFLVESAMIAGLGGLIGSAAGLLGALAIGLVAGKFVPEWETRVAVDAAIVAVAVAAASGVAFGISPARRAASLDVVACLRGET